MNGDYMASIIWGSALLTEQRELKGEHFNVKLKKDKETINRVFKALLMYWVTAFIVTLTIIGLYWVLFTPTNTPAEHYNFTKMLIFFGIIFLIVFMLLYDSIIGEIPLMTVSIVSQYILSFIQYPGMNEKQSLITGTLLYVTISLTTLTIIYYKMRRDGVYLIYRDNEPEE